ncbi:MAG: DUF1254 domain-containing protein [Saprospiraceae bacterium]
MNHAIDQNIITKAANSDTVKLFLSLSKEEQAQYLIAYRTYVYGFGLVLVDETRKTSTNVATPDYSNGHAPINQVGYCDALRDANYTDVVRPNVDTLYDPAWMDLSEGPLVLTVPEMKVAGANRYYILQMMDAYSNVFKSIGTRTGYTDGPYTLFIKGPNDTDATPPNTGDEYVVIQSLTNTVWMLGRVYTTGESDDVAAVNALQAQMTLTPADQYPRSVSGYTPPVGSIDNTLTEPPLIRVQNMGTEGLLNQMLQLWVNNPPIMAQNNLGKEQDERILKEMTQIGINYPTTTTWQMDRQGFSDDLMTLMGKISTQVKNDFTYMKNHTGAPSIALNQLKQHLELVYLPNSNKQSTHNWVAITNKRMGDYQSHYMLRSFIAFSGLGANLVLDAIYPAISINQTETNTYTITFQNDIINNPPIDRHGFWSLTMYGNDQELVATPTNADGITKRYSVSSKSELKRLTFNKNTRKYEQHKYGKVIIFVQPEPPTDDMLASNWLPSPSVPSSLSGKTMALMLRFYWPKEKVLQSKWEYPVIAPTSAPV